MSLIAVDCETTIQTMLHYMCLKVYIPCDLNDQPSNKNPIIPTSLMTFTPDLFVGSTPMSTKICRFYFYKSNFLLKLAFAVDMCVNQEWWWVLQENFDFKMILEHWRRWLLSRHKNFEMHIKNGQFMIVWLMS